jgi:hypothetical protein
VGFDRNIESHCPAYKKLGGFGGLPLTFSLHGAIYRYSCYQDNATVNEVISQVVGTFTPIIGKGRQYLFCHNCGLITNASSLCGNLDVCQG